MPAVTISEAPLTVEELVEVARGAPVELGPEARALILASRAVVDAALASGRPVYGLNTGVGHMKDVRLPDEELRRVQQVLVMTHAAGVGPPLDSGLVRAAMAVRLNGIARGGSGASAAVADTLAAMLNAGVHPVVPAIGSVGAGDLPQMACVAVVATGMGWAEHRGEVLPGAQALARARIEPLVLQPKDGLALMSANGVSIGHGAMVLAHAAEVASAADVAAALSLEATGGNPSVTLAVVGLAKPFPGQVDACRSIRDALAGSHLLLDQDAAHSIQDPLSFRVAPQVHGALREFMAFARRAVEVELNSRSDNPLVAIDEQAMVHNGNFHPIVLALAFDALRGAVAHVGQLSERRMSHLWDAFFAAMAATGMPPTGPPPEVFGISLRYPAAAVFTQLKQLAAPATLDVPPLETGGLEDHGTGAPLSVRKAEEAVGLLADVVAIELMLAHDVLAVMPTRPTLGAGTGAAFEVVQEAVAAVAGDRSPARAHAAVRARLPDVARKGVA
jgi:histidine ammonia-lyase